MEQKLNIAEILKNKPRGTKLYSMIHGKCSFEAVTDEIFKINFCTSKFGLTHFGECTLIKFGNMFDGGECIIFPSEEMRDWSRFAWKRGDILTSNDGETMVIFDKWYDDTYTSFYCRHYFNCEDKNHPVYYSEFLCTTEKYSFKNNQYANHDYLKAIEEKLGGKLNRETLEIEKAQPEFKDGDILCVIESSNNYHYILIYEGQDDEHIYRYVTMLENNSLIIEKGSYFTKPKDYSMRYATEEEKQQLFGALEKEGKAWDSEKKQVVNLKPKCKFKPFDKVLGRNEKDGVWEAELFSHYREESQYPFRCIGFARKYCIPYEGNEYLLGTTNNPKQHNLHDTE